MIPGSHPPTKKMLGEHIQADVRLEKRTLKVRKGLAKYLEIFLGDLIEGIVLHAFDGKLSPLDEDTLALAAILKQVYDMDSDSSAAHNFEKIS